MCLITKNREPNFATTDLYVYKVLIKTIYKPYKLLPFYKKVKYTTPVYTTIVKKGRILKAFYSNSNIESYCDSILNSSYCIKGEGVHAFIKARDADFFNKIGRYNGIITLWKIPKGVKYWISINREAIAATKMQFIKECN